MNYKIIPIVLILALATIACGFSISLPKAPTPGPDVTDSITVPVPNTATTNLSINFGAGEITLNPGAQKLVEGTATYNVPDLKPEVVTDSNGIEIKQGNLTDIPYPGNIKNIWNFKLGAASMDLSINAGAYTGTYELGGLSLTNLTVKDGASKVTLSFSQANPGAMTLFRYETGASNVKMSGLANANFSTMIFNSGAGDYTLDFSGKLAQDTSVDIKTGVSNMTIDVPLDMNVKIVSMGAIANITPEGNWIVNDSTYSASGEGYNLVIHINMSVGNLKLVRH